jgi:membrane protease YdiL (CAAX protease family)
VSPTVPTPTGTEGRSDVPQRQLPRVVVAVCVARVGAVAVMSLVAWWVVGAAGFVSPFPPIPLIACLALLPVNVATLLVVRALLHRSGVRARDVLGFNAGRFGRDLGWGLLWLMVLYLPFAATVVGMMLVLHGRDAFVSFGPVFAPAEMPAFPVDALLALGAVAVITFAPINAPVEELAYRGLAQRSLERAGRRVLAIILPALIFGLQHLFFAPTREAMVVYGAAFLVWGVGSGLIYRWQGRLAPLVISHFVVNLVSTLPALILPIVLS